MAQPLPLTGVVVTRDEGDRIARCLRPMLALCREVIVLDSGSTDDTVAIARALGAQVEHQEWLGYASQKNIAISRASQPWVLLLDADEWLEAPAQQALRALFETGAVDAADAWLLRRRAHFLGHRMRGGGFAREPVPRLFRRHLRHEIRPVHERLDTRGQRVAISGIGFEHEIARNGAEHWRKLQGHARLWADDQADRGRVALPGRGTLAATAYLLKHLVLRLGVVDGRPGLRFHLIQARYARLKYRLLRDAA
ncbi:glycosyltransferase family 2 protein [bacterium BD-1]|nr:glycosyltransferase family 2 protein [Ottowia caeni]